MADSNNNLGWKLSSILLNGVNYVLWSRALTLSLGGKQKLGFINGKSVCPASDSEKENWTDTDSLIRSWLLNSMEPHVAAIFTLSNLQKRCGSQ